MGAVNQEWCVGNAGSSYPFEDDSLPEGFPVDAVVDLMAVVPGDGEVALSCLYIGPETVSLALSVGGDTCLFANARKGEYVEYDPVAMESTRPGVSAFVTFGAVDFGAPRMVRGRIPVSESAIVRVPEARLRRFVKRGMLGEARGDVVLDFPTGVSSDVSGGDVRLSADDDLRAMLPAMCADASSARVPVKTVNGMKPDADGRVAVVFMRSRG